MFYILPAKLFYTFSDIILFFSEEKADILNITPYNFIHIFHKVSICFRIMYVTSVCFDDCKGWYFYLFPFVLVFQSSVQIIICQKVPIHSDLN